MQQPVINSSTFRTEKENFWLPLVKQWQESKESSKAFSQRLNLNLDQFNYWRRKLLSSSAVSTNYLPEAEKTCHCGAYLTHIDNENSEQLETMFFILTPLGCQNCNHSVTRSHDFHKRWLKLGDIEFSKS